MCSPEEAYGRRLEMVDVCIRSSTDTRYIQQTEKNMLHDPCPMIGQSCREA